MSSVDGDPYAAACDELQAAAVGAATALDVESALRRAADSQADTDLAETLRRLAVAFGYFPTREGEPYWGPMIVRSDGVQYPADLHVVESEVVQVWLKVLERDVPALAQARLADLLWSRREGDKPYAFGQRAIDAYVDLAQSPSAGVDRLFRVDDAARAISIARSLNDASRVMRSAQTLIDLARQELAEPAPAPGVVLRALEPLVPGCPDDLISGRDDLLRSTIEVYRGDPFNFQSASDLYALTLPTTNRTGVFAAVIDQWEAAAEGIDGLRQLTHLERAIELAKLYDLPDRLDGLRVKVQEIKAGDLGMQPIRSEIEIAAMDEMLALLVQGTWATTIAAIGSFGPPTGTRDANIEALQGQRVAAPFQAAISRTKIGFRNAVIWRADSGTEDRDRLDLAEIESFRATYSSFYIMAAMKEASGRFGTPSTDALSEMLTTDHVEKSVATKFARGIALYLDNEFELAALILLPQIEACIRHLNTQVGLVVIVEPRGAKPGGVKTLGTLISQLTDVMDRDWCRYLENTLSDPLGHNLRNRALHGLMDTVSQSDAALLVHIACFLSMLRPA